MPDQAAVACQREWLAEPPLGLARHVSLVRRGARSGSGSAALNFAAANRRCLIMFHLL
jgi:hypothetical protein